MPATAIEESDYRIRNAIVLLPLFFGLLLCAFAFHETWLALHYRWIEWTEAYAHGYIAVAASLFLLCKALLRLDSTKPAPLCVILLGLTCFLWFLGARTSTQIVAQASLPLLIWMMVAAIYGTRAAVAALLPIALLYFAIPLWEVFNTSLRLLAVRFSEQVLLLFGIPALIDGFRVTLSYGVIEVAGSCSGLNYLVTGLFTGTLYAGVFVSGIKRKFVCIALALMMALLVNWVRVSSLILIAHYSEMQSSLVYNHHTYGWLLFAVALFFYFFLLERILKTEAPAAETSAATANSQVFGISVANYLTGIACAIPMVFFPWLYSELKMQQSERNLLLDNDIYEKWQIGVDEWYPHYSGWDEEVRLRLAVQPEPIDMLALVYLDEQQGKELLHYKNRIVRDVNDIEVPGSMRFDEKSSMSYRTIFIQGNKYLVAWLYKVEQSHTNSQLGLKYMQFLEGGLKMHAYSSAIIVFKVKCIDESCSKAHLAMSKFAPELSRAVRALEFVNR